MKIRYWILIIICLAAFGTLLSRELISQKAIVTPVIKGTAVDAIPGNVKVLAAMEALVHAEAAGPVSDCISITGKNPIPVKKGDVLLQIQTNEIDREIKNHNARFEASETRLKIGSYVELQKEGFLKDLALFRKLNEEGQYPDSELDKRERDLQNITMNVDNEKVNQNLDLQLQIFELERLEKAKEKMTIKAPFDGLLTETYFLPGMRVFSGNAVAKVMTDEKIIEISISEEDYPGITIGQTATLYFQGFKQQAFNAKIVALKATADPNTKRRSVYVELEADSDEIVPGITGQASIVKNEHKDALIIPRRALVGNFVYVVSHNRISIRKVQPGFVGVKYAEILTNLKAGEWIITENIFDYRNGQHVRPIKKPS